MITLLTFSFRFFARRKTVYFIELEICAVAVLQLVAIPRDCFHPKRHGADARYVIYLIDVPKLVADIEFVFHV